MEKLHGFPLMMCTIGPPELPIWSRPTNSKLPLQDPIGFAHCEERVKTKSAIVCFCVGEPGPVSEHNFKVNIRCRDRGAVTDRLWLPALYVTVDTRTN